MSKLTELQIGDTVIDTTNGRLHSFDCMIVKQIKDGKLTFFRPYGTTTDFRYTGGVICLIGIEVFDVDINDTRFDYTVLERRDLR